MRIMRTYGNRKSAVANKKKSGTQVFNSSAGGVSGAGKYVDMTRKATNLTAKAVSSPYSELDKRTQVAGETAQSVQKLTSPTTADDGGINKENLIEGYMATLQKVKQLQAVQDLGALVREARIKLGWTQEKLAVYAGVGRRFVSDLETGKKDTLELGKALAVCKAVGIEITGHIK